MGWGAGQKATGVWRLCSEDRSVCRPFGCERGLRNETADVSGDVCVREAGGEEGEKQAGGRCVLIMM